MGPNDLNLIRYEQRDRVVHLTLARPERMNAIVDPMPRPDDLDGAVDRLAARIAAVPRSQLSLSKTVVNHAFESMGLATTQLIATLFDGIARHSPDGVAFKRRAEEVGWKQAVAERGR